MFKLHFRVLNILRTQRFRHAYSIVFEDEMVACWKSLPPTPHYSANVYGGNIVVVVPLNVQWFYCIRVTQSTPQISAVFSSLQIERIHENRIYRYTMLIKRCFHSAIFIWQLSTHNKLNVCVFFFCKFVCLIFKDAVIHCYYVYLSILKNCFFFFENGSRKMEKRKNKRKR